MGTVRNSQSSSQRSRVEDMSEEKLEEAVNKVLLYLLSDMRNKKKIRKEDVVLHALDKSSKQYATIMNRVEHNLLNTFGLQLAKTPGANDSFIIVNKNGSNFRRLTKELETKEVSQFNQILTFVLSFIFMNRGQMFEGHVLAALEAGGFLKDKFYGMQDERRMKDYVQKLVSHEFVKQMYLEAKTVDRPEKQPNPPLPDNGKRTVTLLSWGYRAIIEVDIEKIVEYLEKIHDGKKPSGFPGVYYKELKAKQVNLRADLKMLARN